MSGKPRARTRHSRSSRPVPPARPVTATPLPAAGYIPGVCNIGPWEARRRRAFAVMGFAAGIALLIALNARAAPQAARLVLIFPFWAGAFSWLQARRRFCAGFAMAGITNFGEGEATRRRVPDEAAHRADMDATLRMTRDSLLIGLAVTALAVLLPL